jgi:hypothetical protein
MYFINRTVNTIFDAWLWPFQSLSATWQIIVTAVPVTVFALLVFRFASNQEGINAVKNKIKAYLLELWLYKDDLGILFRAQGQVFRYSFIYLRYALVPLLIMIVPLALVIVQLESLYAFRGLHPGESAILAVTVAETKNLDEIDADLFLPEGLVQETPPLRIDASRQVFWRIRGETPGRHTAVIRSGELKITKQVVVGESDIRLASVIYRDGDWRMLGYPAEQPINAGAGVLAVELPYMRGRGEFAGLSSASWLLMFATLVLGFALRGFFGVTF